LTEELRASGYAPWC